MYSTPFELPLWTLWSLVVFSSAKSHMQVYLWPCLSHLYYRNFTLVIIN